MFGNLGAKLRKGVPVLDPSAGRVRIPPLMLNPWDTARVFLGSQGVGSEFLLKVAFSVKPQNGINADLQPDIM